MKIVKDPIFMQVGGIIERTFITSNGHLGVVVFNQGYRNGYVGLPSSWDVLTIPITLVPAIGFRGCKSQFDRHLECTLLYVGFHCNGADDGNDVETSHKFGVPGFKNKTNDKNAKTLDFVIEKINELSAQLTPQAIMEYKMRKANNQN